MTLSVAILTHNEEKNILRTIESVYDWVDEIIVVDGTSTDKTVDLIKEFDKDKKIKVFVEDNPPNFLINKQKAIERCTKDWILQLDADEVVSDDLKKEIIQIVNIKDQNPNVKSNPKSKDQILNTMQPKVAYWIPRLNYFLHSPMRKGGQYPDYVLRLYKNGIAKIPLKSIHDQVEITPKNAEIGYLDNPLDHYAYPTFEAYARKWLQYAIFEGDKLYKQGVRPSFINGVTYLIIYPKWWFLKTYFRHKGFQDGVTGFMFSLFSAIRYWVTYARLIDIDRK